MKTTEKNLPFRAVFYNQEKLHSLADVVTPPYDVITPEMQNNLYQKSPHNFCRIDLTRESAPQRYEIAKTTYDEWIKQGVLVHDAQPALFLHFHSFRLPNGQAVVRRGLFVSRRLEDFSEGGIKPHEKTLSGPKQDRLELSRHLMAQLSPIFALYHDPENKIMNHLEQIGKATPFMDFISHDSERHQLWKIRDPELCLFIDKHLSESPLFIADGHHRYETALNHRNEMIAEHPDLPASAAIRHVLFYVSSMDDPGMVILPIHRAVHGLAGFSLPDFLEKLGKDFTIETCLCRNEVESETILSRFADTHHCFLLIAKDPEQSHLVKISKQSWLEHPAAQGIPTALATLDVTVLHRLILENILGIDEAAQAEQKNLVYWKSTKQAMAETRHGPCQLTFLLNPTLIEQMREAAQAGHKMPQKSTFFYPKIVSGLLLHDVSTGKNDGF